MISGVLSFKGLNDLSIIQHYHYILNVNEGTLLYMLLYEHFERPEAVGLARKNPCPDHLAALHAI